MDADEQARRWSETFRRFGEIECRGSSELYEVLATGFAEDLELLGWFAATSGPRTNDNLLFAAVHYLLLGGAEHALTRFYPTVTRTVSVSPQDAYPSFRDFCIERQRDLTDLLQTRTTQTNEVSRCTYLLPAFAAAGAAANGPLHLIDVGTASGMNLFFDRYHYDYGDGITWGPKSATTRLRTELRGERPVLGPIPAFAARVGVDLSPIEPDDEDATRWLRACVWPEHLDRFHNLEAALEVVREMHPRIAKGNAVDLLPALADEADPTSTLVVTHTNVLPYFSADERRRFGVAIDEIGRSRDLVWIAAEAPTLLAEAGVQCADPERGVSQAAVPLVMVSFREGQRTERVLALTGAHGRWLDWL